MSSVISPTEAKMTMALDEIIKTKKVSAKVDNSKKESGSNSNKKRQSKLNEKRGIPTTVDATTSKNEQKKKKNASSGSNTKGKDQKNARPTKPQFRKGSSAKPENIKITFTNEKAGVVKSQPITSLSKRKSLQENTRMSGFEAPLQYATSRESLANRGSKGSSIIQSINNTLKQAGSVAAPSSSSASFTSLSARFGNTLGQSKKIGSSTSAVNGQHQIRKI